MVRVSVFLIDLSCFTCFYRSEVRQIRIPAFSKLLTIFSDFSSQLRRVWYGHVCFDSKAKQELEVSLAVTFFYLTNTDDIVLIIG